MSELRFPDEQESPRLKGSPFVLIAAGIVFFLAVSLGALWAVFVSAVPNRGPLPSSPPPAPRLLANPKAELEAALAQQQARLRGYHWVDRNEKIVAIPIDRAMAIIATRGADAYAPIPGAPPAPPPQIPELLQGLTHSAAPASVQGAATPSGQPPGAQP